MKPEVSHGLKANIWKYAVILISNKRVFAAILGAYYLTIPEVTPFWIGIFLLVGNGASLIFDIPSSYIADRIGHKHAIVLSRMLMGLSTLLFLLSTNIVSLAFASFCMSMGQAFLSGVGTAFMHETIRALDREREYRSIMGKVTSVGFFVPAIMAALVPFTVSHSYTTPFLIGLVMDSIGLITALTLMTPKIKPEHAATIDASNFVEIIRQGFALKFFRIVLFAGIAGAVLFDIDGFRGPYQVFLGVPVVLFGIFFGAGRILSSILLALSGRLHALIGDVFAYQRLLIVVYGLLLLILGITHNPWIVVVVFILDNGIRYGLSQLETGYELDIIRNHKYKATLLSMGSQIQNLLAMVLVVLMGATIEHIGYQRTFLLTALLFFSILIPFHFWIYAESKKNHGT